MNAPLKLCPFKMSSPLISSTVNALFMFSAITSPGLILFPILLPNGKIKYFHFAIKTTSLNGGRLMEIKIGLEKLARDSKAQVSAELILIMAAVLAVAILLVKQLQDTAKSGSKKIDEKADKVFKEIDKIK